MTGGKLLIVDDETDIREVLVDSFRGTDLEVYTASNGEEALKLAQQHRFDTILSDLNMPVMDGMTFLRQLRKAQNLTPFVVLTGHGDKQAAIEALKLNAFDFLEKPWELEALKDVIAKAIELGQQYNQWNSDEDLVSGLQDIRKDNADEAIMRMKTQSRNRADNK